MSPRWRAMWEGAAGVNRRLRNGAAAPGPLPDGLAERIRSQGIHWPAALRQDARAREIGHTVFMTSTGAQAPRFSHGVSAGLDWLWI